MDFIYCTYGKIKIKKLRNISTDMKYSEALLLFGQLEILLNYESAINVPRGTFPLNTTAFYTLRIPNISQEL